MDPALQSDLKAKMEKALEVFRAELSKIRTGRASTGLLDGVRVACYGSEMPLNQVGTLSVSDARTLVIAPWDKAILGEIEKALQKADLGVQPTNDGKVVRVGFPPLTEERRKELARLGKKLTEECRVIIRNVRRDGNEALKKRQKDGKISEDELKKGEEEIQKLTDQTIARADQLLAQKEKEILEL